MHLNDWPLASHQRRHERQRRSSGDDGIEGSDHRRFAATGRATYPGHSSSSSVSLSPSLVSTSPGVLSGGSMSVSNSSIASTAASTASPTAGTSLCYQQHQQPSYGNNDIGLDEHWRTDSGASSTCSSGADELLSTADGGRVENVGSVEGGFPQFEQLQMPRVGGSSSSHRDGAFPDNRVNYSMNDRNATGHGINGGAFADGALSALIGGGDKLYARRERQRSPPPPQRQQTNHRCDVGSWPPTHVFPDDLEILLEEDAGDEGDESSDSPCVSYTANNNTQQQQQQQQPLKMELPRASSWASSPTAKLYQAGAPQQQLSQPKEQHDVNDVGFIALSGGVVSSPSPEPYHPCSLLPLQQQRQQLQDVLDWPASPRLGCLQAPPSKPLSPMAASSPVVFSTEGDFLQTLQSTGCGGSAAWEHEGSTTTDNGSSDCSEDFDPVPLFPFHPNHHQNNNNGCTFEDSLQSLVEEVTGGGGVPNCFDLADAAAEAAAAASSLTAIVPRASGPKNLLFPAAAAAAAAAAAKVGTAAAAIVPRGVLENVSLGKHLLVSPGSSSPIAAATAAAPVSPPTSPPQPQQQQAPKRRQRPAVGSGKSAKKVAGNRPKKQKKQPLQEQKNPSPVQLKIKTAKKANALETGTPEASAGAAAEGRPRKAARTAATSVAKSPPKSGGVRKAAGRGGGSSTKRVKVSPSKGSPAPASPAVAAGKDGNDGDRFLDDKARRSREKNRDHSRRSRERKKVQLEGLKQASIDLGPYRMLVEQAHDMISVHSADADAFFALASGAFYRQLGFEPTKMLGASLLDLVEPKDVQAVVQAIMDTLSRGGIKQVQYRMRPPSDGDAVEVETSFRMASRRLLAITRIVGAGVPRSVSPAQVPLLAPAAPSGGGGGGGIQPAVAESQELGLGLGSSGSRGVC